MKKLYSLWTLIVCLFTFQISVIAQNADDFVTCIIIDKTASMVGEAGGVDIWADVQDYLFDMVDAINVNTTIVVFEFDGKTYGPVKFEIKEEKDKVKVKDHIKAVKPDGTSTAIYNAMDVALNYFNENLKDNNKLVYLLTDGRDNASQMTFENVIKKFSANKGEYDHLYYIDLRDMADDNVKELVAKTESVSITKGFVKTITIRPVFTSIPYVVDKSQEIEQRFIIDGGVLPEDYAFSCKLNNSDGINSDIIPSRNIKFSDLKKVEEGKYSFVFKYDLIQGAPSETSKTTIKLLGNQIPEYLINFQPALFEIVLKEKEIPKVEVKNGGWQ